MRHHFNVKRAVEMAALAAMGGRFGGGGGGPFGNDGPFGTDGLFGGGGPFGRGPRGLGRSSGRRRFGREDLRLVLLHLLAEQPRHGYDLIKEIEERSGGQYSPSPGMIYPALSLLADEGLIAEQQSDDQRRKFAITPAGEEELASGTERVEEVLARLHRMGERARADRAPQIERAAANLFMAVKHRLNDGGEDDLPHDIAEILDEATRRIERL